MASQGTSWNSQLKIGTGEGSASDKASSKIVLARMIKYCEDEANELDMPFVAYCLSLAMGALAEQVDELDAGWSTVQQLHPRGD